MTALYAIVQPAMDLSGSPFAIVADETGADYVYAPGDEIAGLDAARVQRSAEGLDQPPSAPAGWLGLAADNIGYFVVGQAQPADTIDAARAAASNLLSHVHTRTPTAAEQATQVTHDAPAADPQADNSPTPDWHIPQTREQLAHYQANAAYVWSQQYPEAAAGEVDDPEADLALVQLMTPPVDPTKPHRWLPIATTETDCGFCDQPQEAAIHRV